AHRSGRRRSLPAESRTPRPSGFPSGPAPDRRRRPRRRRSPATRTRRGSHGPRSGRTAASKTAASESALRRHGGRAASRLGRGRAASSSRRSTLILMAVTAQERKLLIGGEWIETGDWIDVASPYSGETVGRVAKAGADETRRAIDAAEAAMREPLPAHKRAEILVRVAGYLGRRHDEVARTISDEAGKPMKAARVEATRAMSTYTFAAVEARKLAGDMVPMDASQAGEGKLGFTLRRPIGVVGAISPFNFPLNLVAHKLGPALAAGNAVVLKPAGQTPISALKLAEILVEAGLPEGWLSVIPGPGFEVGNAIVEHELTRALSFTGSAGVGWGIRSKVPHKKVNLELGSNAPLIVHADGDWETAADKTKLHAYSHAGQSCISIQRILVHEDVADAYTERLVANLGDLRVGDPLDPETDVGPL